MYFTITDEFGIEWEFDYHVDISIPFENNQIREAMVYRIKGDLEWIVAPAWIEPPPGFEAHVAGPTHRMIKPEIPTIWQTFAELRAARDDLKFSTEIGRIEPKVVAQVIERLDAIGDLDEPYAGLFKDALYGSLTPENLKIAKRIASEGDDDYDEIKTA